jgi:hypothetical protein
LAPWAQNATCVPSADRTGGPEKSPSKSKTVSDGRLQATNSFEQYRSGNDATVAAIAADLKKKASK